MRQRLLVSVLVTMVMTSIVTIASVSPAHAASPGNDAFATRTVISSLPFTDALDTTEATVDPNDPAGCGGETDTASVWYEFTASRDMLLRFATLGSAYAAGINAFTGDPSNPAGLALETCSLPVGTLAVQANTTYYFMIAACCETTPDDLRFTLEETFYPEPTITLASVATLDQRTGVLTLEGDVFCSRLGAIGFDIEVVQAQRERIVREFRPSMDAGWCDTESLHYWFGISAPADGRWTTGTATFTLTPLVMDIEGELPRKPLDPITVTVPVKVKPNIPNQRS